MRRVYIYVEYICICMLCLYDDKYKINYWGSTSMIYVCTWIYFLGPLKGDSYEFQVSAGGHTYVCTCTVHTVRMLAKLLYIVVMFPNSLVLLLTICR